MRATFGHVVFAVALVGFGVLSLVTHEFAYIFQPVPPWVPGRAVLAYASGALLLGCSAGLLWPRTCARASLVLMLYGAASMLLVHVPRIAVAPLKEVLWFGLSEIAIFVAGGWILFARAATVPARGWERTLASERGVRLARLLFALALLPIGLSHFVYADFTAKLVPSWLPAHFGWAYLTGGGHLAAAIGILSGIVPRLAATLEGLMVSTFVLTIHVPDLFRTPGGRDEWTELFVACAIGGVALLVAGSYGSGSGTRPAPRSS
jgi:uncharacterized membrane protein